MPEKLKTLKRKGAPANERERRRLYSMGRPDKEIHKFYSTKAWRKTRAAFLAANPLCVECLAEGRHEAATVADHQVEMKDDPTLAYEHSNLKALCVRHHNAKTGRKVMEARR